jgi:hypothetical protein
MADSKTIEKFRAYFESKMLNKLAWWIDASHLPKINGMIIDSLHYNKTNQVYSFGPAINGPWLHNIAAKTVPSSIREIMEKVGCHYIHFTTEPYNYGSLLYYSTDKLMYQKDLDPDQINNDLFAQAILEALIDKEFTTL